MVIVTSTQPVKPLDGRKLQLVCSVKAVRTRAFLIGTGVTELIFSLVSSSHGITAISLQYQHENPLKTPSTYTVCKNGESKLGWWRSF